MAEIDSELSQYARRFDMDRRHADHVAAIADVLFHDLRHLHGLTKTSRRLVRAAALLHEVCEGHAYHADAARKHIGRLTDLPMSASQRRIVAEAVALHAQTSPPPARGGGGDDPELAVALRVGAILRIADGLDRSHSQTAHLAAVVDDGEAVELLLTGNAAAAEAAWWGLHRADLFNRVALRPIRSVGMTAGPPAPQPLIHPADTPAGAARRVLLRRLEWLMSRRGGLAYAEDIEYVHEMRVATRRLRATMRAFRRAVKGGFDTPRDRLKVLADALGAARDDDVFLDFLTRHARTAEAAERDFLTRLIRAEKRKRRQHYLALLAACADGSHGRFLDGLYRTLRRPVAAPGGLQPAARQAQRRVWQEARRALRRRMARLAPYGRRLDRLTTAEQHRLRIDCKKLRYTAELFAEIYPPALAKAAETMVRMQDLLGEAHDAGVYIERVAGHAARRSAGGAPAAAAIERHLREREAQCLAEAARVWMRFTAPKSRKDLAHLIDSPHKA